MNIQRFLFLSFGLTRVYPWEDRKIVKTAFDKLVEPDGSRTCRRNILALSGIVVIGGFAGANLQDLRVFGVTPFEDWGMIVLGLAVILAQLYWYVMRYCHLEEDGVIDQRPSSHGEAPLLVMISGTNHRLVRKSADLFANYAAFLLTGLSWYFIGTWIIEGSS